MRNLSYWTPVPSAPLTPVSSASIAFEEDAFFWKGVRGYHMLTHREVHADTHDGGRVGGSFLDVVPPMTVAMCMRNTLRLFSHFHEGSRDE